MQRIYRTVVSTSCKTQQSHPCNPNFAGRASAFPARLNAFQVVFRIAHAQKNKINLCFVDRLVQIDNDLKIKTKQMTNRRI